MDTQMERIASAQEREVLRPRYRGRWLRLWVLVGLAVAVPSAAMGAAQLVREPHAAVARQQQRQLDQELLHARRDLGIPDAMLRPIEQRERQTAAGAGWWFYNYQAASATYTSLFAQVQAVEGNASAVLRGQTAGDIAALAGALAARSDEQSAPLLAGYQTRLSDDRRALDQAQLPGDYARLDEAVRQQSQALDAFWPTYATLQQFAGSLQQAQADGAPLAAAAAEAQRAYDADVQMLRDASTVARYQSLGAVFEAQQAQLAAEHTQALPALDAALLSTLQDRINLITHYGGDASATQALHDQDAAALQASTGLGDLLTLQRDLTAHIAATAAPIIEAQAGYDLERAATAAKAMRYFSAGGALYRETYPAVSDPRFAYLWPYSQAMAGAIEIATTPGPPGATAGQDAASSVASWVRGLANYWEPARGAYNASVRPPLGIEAFTYYDDNAWAGIDLARAYEVTHDPSTLAQAKAIFAFETTGWAQTAPCQGPAGGVYWLIQATRFDWQRTTTSTAGAADLAAWLYAITGDDSYRQWAERMSDWIQNNMRDPATGLYYDHMSPGGPGGRCVIARSIIPYNQAVMVETDVLLYQGLAGPAAQNPALAQQRQVYLQRAEATARAALAYYKDGYEGQSPPFNAIYFRALRQLYPAASDAPDLQQAILAAIRSYADWAWDNMRDSRSNVNQFPDDYGLPQLLNQGALVSVLADLSACEMMSASQAQASSGPPPSDPRAARQATRTAAGAAAAP